MTRPARRSPLLALPLAATLGACSSGPTDWFRPDWASVDADERARRTVIEDLPEPVVDAPPPPPDLSGEVPVELNVEQAVFLALARNRDLSVAQLTPVISGAFERIERGRFDPEVFAEAEFTRREIIETARSTGEQFGVDGDTSTILTGLRQTLPTGTDVEVTVGQDRTISNRAPEEQSARVGLTVTQSLLRGFGTAVNLASVRLAELDTLASRYELRGFVEALLAETEIAYWRFVLAGEEIAIFERSLEVARQQNDQVRQRIEVGVVAETEAAATESEIAIREQALIDARAALLTSRLELLRLIDALPVGGDERSLVPTSSPTLEAAPIEDVEDRVRVARRLRADINEARLRLEQGRLETIRTRNGLLPRLDVFIALGKTGFADTFADSFRELDGPTYDFAVGVGFSQFIGNESARGRDEVARASRQQAAASVHNLEQLIELDVRLAVINTERARQQIDATATTRRLQENTVQAEIERFDVGASTTLLVAQAQRDLLQAQINEIEAVVAYRVALIELFLAEGTLLERRGVFLGV
jgi:outer membrane protein